MIARFRTFFANRRDRQTKDDWTRAMAAVALAEHRRDSRAISHARARAKDALNARLDFEVSRGGRAHG